MLNVARGYSDSAGGPPNGQTQSVECGHINVGGQEGSLVRLQHDGSVHVSGSFWSRFKYVCRVTNPGLEMSEHIGGMFVIGINPRADFPQS